MDRETVVSETRNPFPVFGLSRENSSFISITEAGSSWESVNADVAGRLNSYNFAYASYRLVHGEAYDVSGKSNNAVYVYEDSLPKGEKISQRYAFVDSGDYVDMALRYRQYLKDAHPMAGATLGTGVPVAVEILGAVDKVKQFLGFPRRSAYALTSFKEAGAMLDSLRQSGLDNLFIRLSGYANGGVSQKVLTRLSPLGCLGGRRDFNGLMKKARRDGFRLYLEGDTLYAPRSGLLDGFNPFRDAAQFASSEPAKLQPYSIVWYGKNGDPYYLARPAYASAMARNFIKAASSSGAAGACFGAVGEDLSADYNPHRRVGREESKRMEEESLKLARDKGLGVWVEGGNDYALPYADIVTGMDLAGNRYSILDGRVPFYQIALNGCVNYAGKPLNLAADFTEELLRSAESGAALSFVFMGADESALSDTEYSQYYGASLASWLGKVKSIYSRYNAELGPSYGTGITAHRWLNKDVAATTFGDGRTVYVNYGLNDYRAGALTVPARDYAVAREGSHE
jgi:hypothetical protein